MTTGSPKRIATAAYQALREALAVIFWNKRPFESYLKTALRDRPDVLAGLAFSEPKRIVADQVVDRLAADEARYQATTLRLMLEVAAMREFPNIAQIKDPEDRALRLAEANDAVARLRDLTADHAALIGAQERIAAERDAKKAQDEAQRKFRDEVEALREEFVALQSAADPHARGRDFEALLTKIFRLFDMEPRLAYDLAHEQIDGSLSFDTDDYIVEARWRAEPVSRGDADIFAAKVRRKGKNALGLFVSINGFSADALAQYQEATPFLAMDGADLYLVLEQRVRLDDLLRTKKRHANETGSCYLPASYLV